MSYSGVDEGTYPSSSCSRYGRPPAWSTEQYRTVLRHIATTPHHAVRRRDLARVLGSDGAAVLRSLVEYGLLTVRPQSALAHDLPQEAFWDKAGREDAVVTMPTPARLHAVLRMHKSGELERGRK